MVPRQTPVRMCFCLRVFVYPDKGILFNPLSFLVRAKNVLISGLPNLVKS